MTNQNFNVLLYYKYVEISDPETTAEEQRVVCSALGLTGRILVGKEGINGTVSGSTLATEKYKIFMSKHEIFAGIEFKESFSGFEPFGGKLKVKTRNEIVALGASTDLKNTGKHLSPKEFREMASREDVVIVDARNDYEHKVGRFKNAITLPIRTFRDFPKAIKQLEDLKDKKVLTYCTGGIRCEKASAMLRENGFNEVYQLHGGIADFGKEFPEDDLFEGTMFVFDNRFAVPVTSKKNVISKCDTCGVSEDKIINCCNARCNKIMVQCSSCYEKTSGGCSPECTKNDRKLLAIHAK